jgi:hypothetical protein
MDTLEMASRLQRSDLDQATLDGLRIMADRLCSEYPFMPGDQLLIEGRSWLRRIVSFHGQRLTLSQHRGSADPRGLDCYRHLAEDRPAETLSLAQPTPLRGAWPGVSGTAQPPKARTVPMTPEY